MRLSTLKYFFRQHPFISVSLEYFLFCLIILWPLLKPGYVFALDMVFTPVLRWPTEFSQAFLFQGALALTNLVLPSWLIQKLILIAILFLAGLGMHVAAPVNNRWARYFAGFLYLINPFVYARFLYGHYLLLLAYAFLPWAYKSFLLFLRQPNWPNALKVFGWSFLIIHASAHSALFLLIVYAITFTSFHLSRRQSKVFGRHLKYLLTVLLMLAMTSSYWLWPLINKRGATADYVIEKIDAQHLLSFRTDADADRGLLWNIAAMYGFWGEREWRYINQKEMLPWWFYFSLVFIVLAIIGCLSVLFRPDHSQNNHPWFYRQRWLALSLAVVYAVAFLFALGVAYQPLADFFYRLNDIFPWFKGYREPQKFVSLIVFVYALLGALGVEWLLKISSNVRPFKNHRQFTGLLTGALLLLPLFYSPGMFNGFRRQLPVTDYPASWYEVNDILNNDQDDFRAVFFPWHQYMSFGFLRFKVVANPAAKFFDREMIAGDNAEFGRVYTTSDRPESKYIQDQVISRKTEFDNLGRILDPLNVKYVMLAQGADYLSYDFLDKQIDLELIYDDAHLKVYRNLAWSR